MNEWVKVNCDGCDKLKLGKKGEICLFFLFFSGRVWQNEDLLFYPYSMEEMVVQNINRDSKKRVVIKQYKKD